VTDIDACLSSRKTDWLTPADVLDVVRLVAPIELDPCAHPDGLVKAQIEYRWDQGFDGLQKPWGVRGLVFVNPPYGRSLKPWMAKCATVAREHRDTTSVLALVPARTDTAWWGYCESADAICFWRGRIRFVGAPGPAPFPSALVYWGAHSDRFADAFQGRGWVVFP